VQHGSLYYRVILPVFLMAGGIENMTRSIAVLRMVNLFLTAATLAGFLWLIGSLPVNRMHAALLGLVICCQPLFLINGCRVANDAFAIAMGTVVIIWALKTDQWERIGLSTGIGILLGLAVWTKSTAIALVPFITGCLLLGVWRKRISLKKVILTVTVVAWAGWKHWSGSAGISPHGWACPCFSSRLRCLCVSLS
jgi:4-amino-4-deoxy-L-arabinose transferase-like glycosyltransferase